ncbi:hypothetical protein [Wenzhouxiangella sp. EGI_FJ10409]
MALRHARDLPELEREQFLEAMVLKAQALTRIHEPIEIQPRPDRL